MYRRNFLVGAVASPLAGKAVIWNTAAAAAQPDGNDWKRRMAEHDRAVRESFPYPIVRVPGAKALETWERMRAEPGTPVVLGGEEDFSRVAEEVQNATQSGSTPQGILTRASHTKFPDDFRARQRRERAEYEERLRTDPNMRRFVESLGANGFNMSSEPPRGAWPRQPPSDPGLTVKDQFIFSSDTPNVRPHDEIIITTLPTNDWTEAFAYLAFGGWNACPPPHEQVAAFRFWSSKFDLVLAGLTGDVLNLRASRVPETHETALSLAHELYEFCPDLVDQGVGTLDVLAAGLMANRWWYFWWD